MASAKYPSIYQYEPLITPQSWQGEEQRFSIRLTQLLDELHRTQGQCAARLTELESKAASQKPSLTFADVYPVGSVYLSSSNTNPSETFGGTWKLVDKEFKPQILSGEEIFTINTTNVSELSNAYCVLSGHNLHLRIYIKNKVAFGEAALQLGTVHFANIGVTRLPITVYGFGASDALNGPLYFSLNTTSGVMTHYDLHGEGSTSTGSNINYHIEQEILPDYMLDSFCSKFCWKRTA